MLKNQYKPAAVPNFIIIAPPEAKFLEVTQPPPTNVSPGNSLLLCPLFTHSLVSKVFASCSLCRHGAYQSDVTVMIIIQSQISRDV